MNTLLANPKPQTITIRVVFDGAADAGKTTAVYSLAEILGGTALSPAGKAGSTEWFDWLSYSGGQHEGNALQVEVVTVPGSTQHASRRRHLVAWGDVIVFVADTSPAAFDASIEAFRQMKSDLLTRVEVPVIVVANKRDVEGAVTIDQLRSDLALSQDDAVIETIAVSGDGVREGFIYAVRAALAAPLNRTEPTTSDDLLAELEESDAQADSVDAIDDATPSAPLAMMVLSDAALNPDGLVDGAVVLQPAHWQMIVDVVNGRSQLPLADGTDDAATAFELVSWGLIHGTESVVFADADTTEDDSDSHADDDEVLDTDQNDGDDDPAAAHDTTSEHATETTQMEGTTPMPTNDSPPALEHHVSPSS